VRFQKVQPRQVLIPQERHQPVESIRVVVHVVQHLLESPQQDQVGSHAERPPPDPFEPHLQDVPQDLLRNIKQPLRFARVDDDFPGPQLVQVAVVRERSVPAVGSIAACAGDLGIEAPPGVTIDAVHAEERFDDAVVANLLGPVDLLPKPELPQPCEVAFGCQLSRGNQLIPGVLRVREDERSRLAERVVREPEPLLFRLQRMGRELGHALRQLAKNASFLAAYNRLLGAQQCRPVAGPGQSVRVPEPIAEPLSSACLRLRGGHRPPLDRSCRGRDGRLPLDPA